MVTDAVKIACYADDVQLVVTVEGKCLQGSEVRINRRKRKGNENDHWLQQPFAE